MTRRAEQIGAGRFFDKAAGVHHGDPVDVLGDDTEIVADQDQRHTGIAADAAQQRQDLRLDGGIECRGGLIGHQQVGLAGQRHGDHHALVQAAGEKMRIVLQAAACIGDADLIEQTQRLGLGRLSMEAAMKA